MRHDQGIRVTDGTVLAADVYLPAIRPEAGLAALIEALPYRKDDVTESYRSTYERYVASGFAVVRVDLRGTGSSTGVAVDEYPDIERADLRDVIDWVTSQTWSSGRVGMFGTSYSGFNALQMSAEVDALDLPALGAVVAAYATDDRYTDDVHYCGGVLRALDLIDYPLYMVAMNALPPVPAVVGERWRDEWRLRLDETPPWLVEWLAHPVDAPTWRRGSIRLGPDGLGYERMGCPVMLVVGWADGYRNNSFRVIEQYARNGLSWRLLAGPWVHRSPSRARPGPNVDDDAEIIAFFDQHLRDGVAGASPPGQVYVREFVEPAPDLAYHPGRWVDVQSWPWPDVGDLRLRSERSGIERFQVVGDVGMAAWNSCGGALPWGQPLDQRGDNVRSLCWDWPITESADVLGNPVVRLRVASDRRYGHVSVKLCEVAPDGTSTLISRGMLDLRHRDCWPVDGAGEVGRTPVDLVPNEFVDVAIEVEATTWRLTPGHVLRLAVAGTDWPNCWPPPGPLTLSVDAGSIEVSLPALAGLTDSNHSFAPGDGPADDEADGVVWRFEHDVVGRESRVVTRYGGTYHGRHGATVVDDYRGEVGVSTSNPAHAWARGTASFEITWPAATVRTEATLETVSDESERRTEITLRAWEGGTCVIERVWTTTGPNG